MGTRERLDLHALHAGTRLPLRTRDDGFIERNLAKLLGRIAPAHRKTLARSPDLKQSLQRMRAGHRLHASADRTARLGDGTALRALQRLAQLAAVGDVGAGGVQGFEGGLRMTGFHADP